MDSKQSSVTYRGEKGATADRVENIENVGTVKEEYGKTATVSEAASTSDEGEEDKRVKRPPPSTARELVTEILRVEDDPTVNPWTFRMWFIGIGMSVFAG
jgi:hypothetical protein